MKRAGKALGSCTTAEAVAYKRARPLKRPEELGCAIAHEMQHEPRIDSEGSESRPTQYR